MRSRKIIGLLVSVALATTSALVASAQLNDVDADGVPDFLDNCVEVQNGPLEGVDNQVDADGDGFGNACDMDFDQSGYVGLTDHNALWSCFGQISSCPDGDLFDALDVFVDGQITTADFARFLGAFGRPFDAVSGLACADPTLRTTRIGGPDPVCE